MSKLWLSLLKRFKKEKSRKQVTLTEKYKHFKRLCLANDNFLKALAQLLETYRSLAPGDIQKLVEQIRSNTSEMASCLNEMSGGRYLDLVRKVEEIDRLIASKLSLDRPMEVGKPALSAFDADSTNPSITGGKAAHLARLAQKNIVRVPPFYVMTSYAYNDFLEASGVYDFVRQFLTLDTYEDEKKLEQVCVEISRMILAAKVPDKLVRVLEQSMDNLGAQTFSLRSSATVEDSQASFAGQFETVFPVKKDDAVSAYKRVVASKYRASALKYGWLKGILDEDIKMAVIVMPVLRARYAGVAYSMSFEDEDLVLVSGVSGLAPPLVQGAVEPCRFSFSRKKGLALVDYQAGKRDYSLRINEDGLLEKSHNSELVPVHVAKQVVDLVLSCEKEFGCPQDIEWVFTEDGELFVVQSRPLLTASNTASSKGITVSKPPIITGGVRACGGVASGKVHLLYEVDRAMDCPPGSILVVSTTSPRLVSAIGKVKAILAETGSATGHLATVAREFNLPMLVGIKGIMGMVQQGQEITVDAWERKVYNGCLLEEIDYKPQQARSPIIQTVIELTAPLHLDDPRSFDFRVEHCKTLHDCARFAHQKAMTEMFSISELPREERKRCRQLKWKCPMEVKIIDVGNAIKTDKIAVSVDEVDSPPFVALVEGMSDPRVRWAGPVGFDLKGFMSVVVTSAADDQRYGEPACAIIAEEFVHFYTRLAYHFSVVDAMCSELVDQNYIRFCFFGGAAVAERRERRVLFLATVLKYHDFQTHVEGDRVEAFLGKRPKQVIEDTLVMLGRLLIASRQLDMLMEDEKVALAYANAFLSGDYGFDFVRRG